MRPLLEEAQLQTGVAKRLSEEVLWSCVQWSHRAAEVAEARLVRRQQELRPAPQRARDRLLRRRRL